MSSKLSMASVYARLLDATSGPGGQSRFAEKVGCTPAYVSAVLNAKRPASDLMLAAIGVKRVVEFHETKEAPRGRAGAPLVTNGETA